MNDRDTDSQSECVSFRHHIQHGRAHSEDANHCVVQKNVIVHQCGCSHRCHSVQFNFFELLYEKLALRDLKLALAT